MVSVLHLDQSIWNHLGISPVLCLEYEGQRESLKARPNFASL